MARRELYRPEVLPHPGAVYPLGHLTRLEVNQEITHTEAEWDFPPSKRAPLVLWSRSQNAIYIPLTRQKVVKRFRGVPEGYEDVADDYNAWRRDNLFNKRKRKGQIMEDKRDLPQMRVVGSMIVIRYYSDKHNLGWELHSHRPAGDKDIVSVNKNGKARWIFIKGPRMRATTWGIKY